MTQYVLYKNPEFLQKRKNVQKGPRKAIGKFVNKQGEEVRRIFNEDIHRNIIYTGKKYKYCDITGFPCEHTHPKYGLNYLNMEVYYYINGLNQQQRNNWLQLKNLNPI